MESFEFAQEAVQGELQNYPFLQFRFPELHEQSHRVQCEACLEVFWDCLLHILHEGVGLRWKWSNWLHGDAPLGDDGKGKKRSGCWRLAKCCASESSLLQTKWEHSKRHFEAIFAFIIVNETLIEELPVFDDFPHIRNCVNRLLEVAMAEKLYQLHKQSPEMFIMIEHILSARLLLIHKRVLLQHLQKEGVLKASDVEKILETVLEPSFQKLTGYAPDRAMMDIMNALSNPGMQLSF
eukprot:g5799.t1